jgi:hypothetical protein
VIEIKQIKEDSADLLAELLVSEGIKAGVAEATVAVAKNEFNDSQLMKMLVGNSDILGKVVAKFS